MSFGDRSEISRASKAGWGVRSIARHLVRCPSVISREIWRNTMKTRGYQAVTADVAAQRRRARPQQRKVAKDPVLQARVEADLAASWTPNEIAGRLRLEAADATVDRMANSPDARGAPSLAKRSTSTSTPSRRASSPSAASSCSPTAPGAGPARPAGLGAGRSWGWCR
nr:helix-turn-helix domain-containing protein [Micrococcus luteus]